MKVFLCVFDSHSTLHPPHDYVNLSCLFPWTGSCWAWAVVGAVEGLNHIRTGNMIRLSAQQLLDCDKKENGCKGGKLHMAYDYIAQNGGIDSLENYPYKAEVGECKKDTVRYFSLPYLISFCEIPLLIYIYYFSLSLLLSG